MARTLNAVHALLVRQGASRGLSHAQVDDFIADSVGTQAPVVGSDDGLAELMGGITMDDLLRDDEAGE